MLNYKIPKLLYFLIIVGGIAFCILTIANGRSQTSGSLLLAIIDRIFKDNQYTAIIGFRYIFEQPTQWCYDWGMQIANLLPNQNSYLALDYVINNIIYGGYGGTCPPSFIGSVYYNLGGGITPFFLLGLGYLYQHITYLFYKRATNPLDVTCYAFLVVKLGSWVAGDISNLLNSGVLVVLCLQIYMNFLARKRRNKYVCRIRSINKVDITMH